MKATRPIMALALLALPVALWGAAERPDSTRHLQEVVVTGTNSSGMAANLLPYTVSTIGERRLESSGEPRILSAISGMVPSLFVSERSVLGFGVSNGGSGHIKLRGVGGDRASAVLMMVDGQPQFAGIYSHHIADFYGKEHVERVEVLRGPGSVLYGSNAMAGAINVITRQPRRHGVHTTHRHGNAPIYPKLSDPESTDIYRQSITRGEASVSATNSYGSTDGLARVYYSYGHHYVDDPRHFRSTDDRLGVMVYQNFHPWNGASATAGFDFDSYSGAIPMSGGNHHTEGSMSTISRKRITEYSPYLTLSQSFAGDRLNINGGVRMANSDKFDTRWVPQVGAALNPGLDFTIKGNLAMGYRNPSFRELYLYRMANPDLQPEQMMNYEVSVGKTFSRYLTADLTAYYSRGRDMIQVVDNKNVNTGRFINKGIEISARSHPIDNLWLFASYSYLHTSLTDLVGAPKNQYYLGAELTLLEKVNIAADLKGAGGLYVAPGMDHQSFALVNMKISWSICRYLDIFTRLENITDARYTINRGYEMPGFTAMGGFKASF